MQMTNRRLLLTGGLVAGAAGLIGPRGFGSAIAQSGPTIFDEFVTPETDPEFNTQASPKATGRARHDEVVKGVYLLLSAPRTADHMEIAGYFSAIREKNSDGELYNSEWHHDRSNPMIVSMFSATFTAPSVLNGGDETAWCAAFVNFVLMQSGRTGSWSALSGSFRKTFEATKNPNIGDIVVLRDKGPSGDKGHGHVGFLDAAYDGSDKIQILGGNQGGHGGVVSSAAIDIKNGSKELHSFRSVP
jgi:uncharacterized protein (TIGR02594 family)